MYDFYYENRNCISSLEIKSVLPIIVMSVSGRFYDLYLFPCVLMTDGSRVIVFWCCLCRYRHASDVLVVVVRCCGFGRHY